MRRPTLATLALSLLALLFGWETRQALQTTPGGRDNAATVTAATWQPGASAPDPQPSPDPSPAAAAVAARPLFRPDRQPFREQSAGAPVRNYEAEMSRFTLAGVLDFGDAPVGIVVGKAGSKGERWEVRRGDSLHGFKVREVGMDGLRLTADGREFLLPLYAGAPTAAGSAVRTNATHGDAARPAAAQGSPAAVKPAVSDARPGPAAAPAPAPPAAKPRTAPVYTPPYRTLPGITPRFVPGRR